MRNRNQLWKLLLIYTNIGIVLFAICFYRTGLNNIGVTILSLVSSSLMILTFKTFHENILSFGFVFILYNLISHFGFGFVYFLIDQAPANEMFAPWTLAFTQSPNYADSIIISIIAFEVFTLAWSISLNRSRLQAHNDPHLKIEVDKICYSIGMIMLITTALFFIVSLATGIFSLRGSYQEFRKALVDSSGIYSMIIVFYGTGLAYIVSSADGKKLRIGLVIFAFSAVILFLTGNKGEVLYAVLAALGIIGYKKKRLNVKLILLLFVLVFILIPLVSMTRSDGVINSLSDAGVDILQPFMEMGFQIRCVVYSVDGIRSGAYEYMMGYSYFRPVLRIIGFLIPPLRDIPDLPIDLNVDFAGMGFTQVAESYLNYGIAGAIIFYILLGFAFGRIEFKRLDTLQLCLVGSILIILINMSRNTFVFVPGQTVIMISIYFIVKFFSNNRRKRVR